MKYVICTVVMATLALVASASRASDGIPASALQEMGLGGMTAMPDSEAIHVRGTGAFAGGVSWAIGPFGTSGNVNAYGGLGKYSASGAGGSAAGAISFKYRKVEHPDGTESSVLKVRGYAVFAGGYATAKAF